MFGCSLARLMRRTPEDVIAIAIETGVQNTGMSIFILWFTLDHPLGDLTGMHLSYLVYKHKSRVYLKVCNTPSDSNSLAGR